MTISIDGKVHKGVGSVRYGKSFPRPYRNEEIDHPEFGLCKIYIVKVGHPKWSNRLTVKVPVEFYITQILEPSAKYLKERKRKKIGLELVKG